MLPVAAVSSEFYKDPSGIPIRWPRADAPGVLPRDVKLYIRSAGSRVVRERAHVAYGQRCTQCAARGGCEEHGRASRIDQIS